MLLNFEPLNLKLLNLKLLNLVYQITIQNQTFEAKAQKKGATIFDNNNNEINIDWDLQKIDAHNFSIIYQNQSYNIEIIKNDLENKMLVLKINGNRYELQTKTELDLLLQKMGMDKANVTQIKDVKAPMPGLIREIKTQIGQQIQKGDAILILEAMKMENILKSPTDGIVKAIKVKQGDNVEKNQILVSFE